MKFIDKKEVDKNALQKWDEDSIRLQRDLIEPYWNVKLFASLYMTSKLLDLIEPYWNVKQGGLYVRNWPHRI